MRFFFADSHDYVDPGYDFVRDEQAPGRIAQRDDVYAHEYLDEAPYDGILISRATVGDAKKVGKYSTSQMMRLLRVGARAFLRYDQKRFGGAVMGDCGAFSYVNRAEPRWSSAEMVEFYQSIGVTYGVSVDHVVLGYDEELGLSDDPDPGTEGQGEWRRRYWLTLELAQEFIDLRAQQKAGFTPVGVAQGWSPDSYAHAVERLVSMGYEYVALGGLAAAKTEQIHAVLRAVRAVHPTVPLHLFGFTKADDIHEFVLYDLASFDSTSPMLRAFKDGTRNYYTGDRWYTALRIPDAGENRDLKASALGGVHRHRDLRQLERRALESVREWASGRTRDVESAVDALLEYEHEFALSRGHGGLSAYGPRGGALRERYRETLVDRPWERCGCRCCREVGVEVLIFRGSNRNRRRGFHNLWAFRQRLASLASTEQAACSGL